MKTSIVTNQRLDRIDAQPVMARNMTTKTLGVTLAFMVILLAMFAPRMAEARPGYLDAVIGIPFPTSSVAYLCGNCHTNWNGGSPGYSSRLDFVIYNGLTTAAIPTTNTMYLMDSDQDGRTNLEEILASTSSGRPAQFPTGVSTGPNVANNWNWQIPDVDGDGCSSYFSRFTEAGVHAGIQVPNSVVAVASIVGTGNNYRRFNPRGWDIDDNDASQGCSDVWTNTVIATAPGTSGDLTKPGKVNTFSGAGLASGVIPLKWVPVGDDGNGLPGDQTGGKAHSYEIRYTTAAFASGTIGRNPRSPADWEVMHNIAEPDEIDSGGFWSSPSSPDSLMQALYEPRPDVPGTAIQTCNARNTTCTAGASYDIKARGTSLVVNAITNGTTYWVGMWTHDGVTRVTGNLTTPGTVTEQATLSNIIAVTAGLGGAAISTISPATLSAPGTVTVSGYGLHVAGGNAAQMVLTNTAGTVVATAAITASPATAALGNLVGNFSTLPAAGTYNLELRTAAPASVTKAAWVQAITVGDAPSNPVLTSVTPNSRGQGAVGQSLALVGTGFGTGMTITFSDANITGTIADATVTPTTATAIVETVGATASPGAGTTGIVIVTTTSLSNTMAFTATRAPAFTCTPAVSLSGTVGEAYPTTVCAASSTVTGVTVTPYTWATSGFTAFGLTAVTSGANNETLTISGNPNLAGAFGTSITLTDQNAGTVTTGYSILISGQPFTVTATAGMGGVIAPASQVVGGGSTASFTVIPDTGYAIASVTDTCGSGGSLSGMTYTTGAVSMDCAVTAIFMLADTTPPVITPNPLGRSTPPFIGPLTVTLSSNEPNTTVFYTMNGGTPTTSSPSCAAPCTLTITRSTLLQYRGRDAAGNLSASAYQVYKIAAVDLVMTHVSKTATTVKRGASFAITNAARNIGTLRSPPFKISFYLSTDRIITSADRKLTGYRTIPFGLAAGASTPIAPTTVTVPIATPSGIYYVAACVDSDKLVSESYESNNCKVAGSSTITGSATITVTN